MKIVVPIIFSLASLLAMEHSVPSNEDCDTFLVDVRSGDLARVERGIELECHLEANDDILVTAVESKNFDVLACIFNSRKFWSNDLYAIVAAIKAEASEIVSYLLDNLKFNGRDELSVAFELLIKSTNLCSADNKAIELLLSHPKINSHLTPQFVNRLLCWPAFRKHRYDGIHNYALNKIQGSNQRQSSLRDIIPTYKKNHAAIFRNLEDVFENAVIRSDFYLVCELMEFSAKNYDINVDQTLFNMVLDQYLASYGTSPDLEFENPSFYHIYSAATKQNSSKVCLEKLVHAFFRHGGKAGLIAFFNRKYISEEAGWVAERCQTLAFKYGLIRAILEVAEYAIDDYPQGVMRALNTALKDSIHYGAERTMIEIVRFVLIKADLSKMYDGLDSINHLILSWRLFFKGTHYDNDLIPDVWNRICTFFIQLEYGSPSLPRFIDQKDIIEAETNAFRSYIPPITSTLKRISQIDSGPGAGGVSEDHMSVRSKLQDAVKYFAATHNELAMHHLKEVMKCLENDPSSEANILP